MPRQLRLGDILDDYCPRERRVTNHAIVAMVGDDVKQTRCTTCDADHEYKHAKIPRQRKKADAVLAPPMPASQPKRIIHDEAPGGVPRTLGELVAAKEARDEDDQERVAAAPVDESAVDPVSNVSNVSNVLNQDEHDDDVEVDVVEEGPVHRPLIRATLPRAEGQAPPQRPAPEFTIRQPGGRGRFRPRNQRGGQPFGNRSNGNTGGGGYGSHGGFGPRQAQGSRGPQGPRGPQSNRPARHHDRKRSK